MTHIERCNLQGLLREAERQGVSLWVEGDRLRFLSRSGTLPVDLRAALQEAKPVLIELLRDPKFSARSPAACTVHLPYQLEWWNEATVDVVSSSVTNVVYKVSGRVETAVLEEALKTTFARHRLLSARVSLSGNGPCISFSPHEPARLDVYDYTASAEAAPELAARMVWVPLEGGLLFRAFIAKLTEDCHLVGFVLHHFVADTWSCLVLGGEMLEEIRAAGLAARPTKKNPLQYCDYLLALGEWLDSESADFRLNYWKETMKCAPAIRLPSASNLSPEAGRPPASPLSQMTFIIEPALRERMVAVAAEAKATLFTVILAAKFVTLHKLLRSDDLILSVVLAGRTDPALVDMVGNTATMVPLRVFMNGDLTFLDLLAHVRNALVGAHRHQMPWGLIRGGIAEVAGSEVSPSVNYYSGGAAPPRNGPGESGGLQFDRMDVPLLSAANGGVSWHSSHQMYLFDSGQEIRGAIKFLPLRYEDEAIGALIAAFLEVLSYCVAAPMAHCHCATSA